MDEGKRKDGGGRGGGPAGPEPVSPGLSRRSFLRGAAVAGLAAPELARAAEAAAGDPVRREHGVEVLGPGPVPVRLDVNGRVREVRVEPRVTLLDALRDRLGLTGAKRVCDRGTCGACTVLLEGRPVYACSLLAVQARGRRIETVESLGTPERLHPLQAAFVANDAQQCGFCTPGFVMAAKALVDRVPDPSVEQVHEALSGNFCRCGTYAGLRRAVAGAGQGGRDA
ncbi:MAG TPA: (2Fe-2S)-binding protein [Thermoanaerobaculia bacterium]|nr:(2Fe-2S)-binding protein [Thermoanaerobaculia bacterium]